MARPTQLNLFAPPDPDESAAFVSRPYIDRWVSRTLTEAMEFNSGLLVAATGLGKTPFAGKLFKTVLEGGLDFKYPGRRRACLFIAHTDELVRQAFTTISDINPTATVSVEQGEAQAGGEADIVIASRDTLCKHRRLNALGRDRFTAALVDECHHYSSTSSKWKAIRDWFDCFWGGVTATPDGAVGDLQDSFETVIDFFPMVDAIMEGWLCTVHQRYEYLTDIELDLTHRGDWTDEEVAEQMQKSRPLATIIGVARKYGCMVTRHRSSRPVVVVCASPRIAEKVSEGLNSWHGKVASGLAVCLHGKQEPGERGQADNAFRAGEARYLCIHEVGLEGYDYDEIGVVVNARPSSKRHKVEQMAGRGVRPLKEIREALAAASTAEERRAIIAASRKPGCLFVDLTGSQLKLAMRCASLADVFAGRMIADPEPGSPSGYSGSSNPLLDLKRKMAAAGNTLDVAGTMKEILEAERAALREKIKSMRSAEAARWAPLGFKVTTAHITIDPFDLFDVRLLPQSVFKPGRGATPGQKRALTNMGVGQDMLSKMTRRQAKLMLEVMQARRRAGLCTYKMAATLRKFGYDPHATMDEAAAIINALAANNWQRPDDPAAATAVAAAPLPIGASDAA